jgi:carboxylesterase type B
MLVALAASHVTAAAQAAPQRTVVTTPSGKLRGFVNATRGGLRVFRGVPYAKPPLGELRWRGPEPYGAWSGVRDAVDFGNPCIQPLDGGWNTVEDLQHASEDCLYLNVVAPPAGGNASSLHPVVVYLHAGEFHYGAASDRESDWPFANDLVLVTPNSRLGPFGFLGSDTLRPRSADNSTGSYGLADQRLALRWVQQNIAAFGGNASNVMLMGESSGGTSVALHLVSAASWGLFHRVVLESPGLTQVKPMADAEVNFAYLTSALLAANSPGCKAVVNHTAAARALAASDASGVGGSNNATDAYARFDDAFISDGWGPHRHKPLVTATNWSYAKAASTCDATPRCVGFSMVALPRSFWRPARVEVELHAHTFMVGAGYLRLPPDTTVTSFLRAAAGGKAAVDCLQRANASMVNQLTAFMPKGDTFYTDAWAPAVDGAAIPETVIARLDAGHVAPGVAILAGSNMDEGTIFMGLTPRLRCDKSTAKDLEEWAVAFYGPTLGAQIPHLYAEPRMPVPKCGQPYAAEAAAGEKEEEEVMVEVNADAVEGRHPPPRRRRRGLQVAAAAAARAEAWLHEMGAETETGPASDLEAPPAPPAPPPTPGLYYMAAMRSAGDYAITCRVRQMAARLSGPPTAPRGSAGGGSEGGGGWGVGQRNHSIWLYYFAHTPRFSENYDHLDTLGAFHGSEVPFVFGDAFELKTDAERKLSAAMGCYWRNFAHTGDPNRGPCVSIPRPWARFVPGNSETTLVLDIGDGLQPERQLKTAQCRAFAKAKGWPDA